MECGVFYFKIDRKNDILRLFMCTNIQIAGKIQPEGCLGSGKQVKIQAWRRKLVIGVSSMELPEINGKIKR